MNSKFLNMTLDITHSFKWLQITAVNLNEKNYHDLYSFMTKRKTCLEQLTDWQIDQLTDQLINFIQIDNSIFISIKILLNHYKYFRTTTKRKI